MSLKKVLDSVHINIQLYRSRYLLSIENQAPAFGIWIIMMFDFRIYCRATGFDQILQCISMRPFPCRKLSSNARALEFPCIYSVSLVDMGRLSRSVS